MREKKPRSPSPEKRSRLQEEGVPPCTQVPTDTVVVRSFDDWVLYYSLKERSFYINTLDYHPKPLKLPLRDLFEMLGDVERIVADTGADGA